MKNCKRLLTMVLSFVMATSIFSLCACQKTGEADQSQTTSSVNSVVSSGSYDHQSAETGVSQSASVKTSEKDSGQASVSSYASQSDQSASQSDQFASQSDQSASAETSEKDSGQTSVSSYASQSDQSASADGDESQNVINESDYTSWVKP